MAVIQADVFGSPNIGVYSYCSEKLVIVPPGLTNRKMNQLAETLAVDVCKTTIGGSTLVGALVTGNSHGFLVPHIIRDYELERIRQFSKVTVINTRWTALGNVVLANDVGAVVHPDASGEIIAAVSEQLHVKSVQAKLGTLPFVGALGIATNKGALVTDHALEEERSVAESALGVNVELGTTNGGVHFVRSGILANSKGAVLGPLTRGAELMQITRALGV
jgi:translation initiation factor 6